jgi:hypothetical protein
LPELSRFLTAGFRTPPDSEFAAPDVLEWKYFDPRDDDAGTAPRSYLARELATGLIVGHLGVCPTRFRGLGLRSEGVSTLHMIDWLSSAAGAGAALMRRAHREVDTQYGVGGSVAGRTVGGRGGYAVVGPVPVYRRVLRPGYALRQPGVSLPGRLLQVARATTGVLARPTLRSKTVVELHRVEAFGQEIERVLAACAARAVFTSRAPGMLNHVLRYPRGGITGWHILHAGALRGFAVLSVLPRENHRVQEGRLTECLLDDPDDSDLWHAAVAALSAEFARRGADTAVAFASTSWSTRALRAAGYAPAHTLEFRLRDGSNALNPTVPYHFTPMEADYAYT